MNAGGGGGDRASGADGAGHDPTAYGASIADEYDSLYEGVLDTPVAVDRLVELAAGGPVLELGIGTGRLALPLAARGLTVHGVEASPAMVERLRTKPGGTDIAVTLGDFTDVSVPGPFSLVVLAFNTIFALPSEDAQVACFHTAARHLAPGGRFVLEAWVLDAGRFVDRSAVSVRHLTAERLSLDTARIDAGGERMETVQVVFGEGAVRLFPANHTYVGPRQLDLMARSAGLRREHRWAGWDRRQFDVASRRHVTVYRKPDEG
ncbi:MAG TPA: class I SAM-dependent methyltransferase [Acidimicrobiales bacterium]|nr:class I SAM-dependent methyltransferase [Acidimicrobiales bacterium]